MRTKATVETYLESYALPEKGIADSCHKTYEHVVAIPAFAESLAFLSGIAPAVHGKRVLCILVVNATTETNHQELETNETLLNEGRTVATHIEELPLASELWCNVLEGVDILALDRTKMGWRFSPKSGVGLARRLGCDLALAFIAQRKVISPWIHMTDADVELPRDYFCVSPQESVVALTYPFEHIVMGDSNTQEAVHLYEIWLRYYVLGLRWAGSPYAFHTIGSTFAVHGEAYAKARGIPDRRAGEDFYFINKVSKLGRIVCPTTDPLRIQGRPSHRVPFGTGAGVRRITCALERGEHFFMYHPKSFELLRDWLQALEQVAETANKLPIQKFIQTQSVLSTSSMLRVAEEAGVDSACERAISEASTESRRRRHLHTWFDAFRTLKWLHAVRNAGLADLEWREALRNAQFLQATESEMAIHRAEVVRRMLSHLDMPTKSLTESSRFAQNSIAVHS